MGVACIQISTSRALEFQSDATPGTLILNAVAAGFAEADVQEVAMDIETFMGLVPKQDETADMVSRRTLKTKIRVGTDVTLRDLTDYIKLANL